MEWMNRGGQTQATQPAPAGVPHSGGRRKRGIGPLQLSSVALLFLCAIVALAVVFFLVNSNSNTGSTQNVDKNKMQAVFLNGGQVYFGKIKDLNSQTLRMDDIYYLRVNQTVQPNQQQSSTNSNDISLVKLGCELHGPDDSMVINQSQVIFWENLKTNGQVAKAVETYKKQNPTGQQCNTQTNTSTQQGTGTTNTNTNANTTNR